MARVTVEDCLEKVDDRFELVALAAQRAKAIGSGSAPTIERNGEKNTVISLREIAGDHVDVDELREAVIRRQQTQRHMDEDVQAGEESEGTSEAVAELQALEGEGQVEEFEEEVEIEAASEAAAEDNEYSFADDNMDVVD